ncbi:hypothetical protein ACIO7M_10565 [Streptomyces toxytricini]|uniref:Uncharacterized protein n=1 Tax=Streptomyces toxytricini TaxID=67369 RepID=A0ABW8EHU4_STRT5
MSIYEFLHADASAALILACPLAASYVLLVLIVLISPDSGRGKAAKDLLSLHPFSRKTPDSEDQP